MIGNSTSNKGVQKAEKRVSLMIFTMVIAFFVAWGPYAVFSLIVAFTDIKLTAPFLIAPSLFAKSSVCYNPIIYFLLNSQVSANFLYITTLTADSVTTLPPPPCTIRRVYIMLRSSKFTGVTPFKKFPNYLNVLS